MVYAQPRHASLLQQAKDNFVYGCEDGTLFYADGGQLVNVEEAAVVNLVGGDPPVRQTIRLFGEKLLQAVEAARVVPPAVQLRERLMNGVTRLLAALDQA